MATLAGMFIMGEASLCKGEDNVGNIVFSFHCAVNKKSAKNKTLQKSVMKKDNQWNWIASSETDSSTVTTYCAVQVVYQITSEKMELSINKMRTMGNPFEMNQNWINIPTALTVL